MKIIIVCDGSEIKLPYSSLANAGNVVVAAVSEMVGKIKNAATGFKHLLEELKNLELCRYDKLLIKKELFWKYLHQRFKSVLPVKTKYSLGARRDFCYRRMMFCKSGYLPKRIREMRCN